MIVFVIGFFDAIVDSDCPSRTLAVAGTAPVDGAVLAVSHLVISVTLEQKGDASPLSGHI